MFFRVALFYDGQPTLFLQFFIDYPFIYDKIINFYTWYTLPNRFASTAGDFCLFNLLPVLEINLETVSD